MVRIRFPRLEVSRTIDASPEAAWEVLTDTSRWPEWGPSVKAVECPERFIRRGSRGRVQTAVGVWAPFVVTRYEDGKAWAWKVYGLDATGHRVEPAGEGRSHFARRIGYGIVARPLPVRNLSPFPSPSFTAVLS
jgi:uncharacterized protein YndB with AHSA1/START domain